MQTHAALARTRNIELGDRGAYRGALLTLILVICVFLAPYVAGLVGSLLHLSSGFHALLWLVFSAGMVIPAVRSTRPPEVTVGDDGLCILTGGKTRFIPMEQVEGVVGTEGRLEVLLTGGKKRVFRSASRLSIERIGTLARWVDEAKRERRRRAAAPAKALLLERKGRSLSAWREALRQLSAEAGSYRAAVFSKEEIVAVLESADASPEQRIGAALVLREAEDLDAPRRIRVAAGGCARAKVRIALETIAGAEAEEEALEAALAEVTSAKR